MSPGEKNSALVKTSNLYGQGEDLLNLFFFFVSLFPLVPLEFYSIE